ncbi:MAG: Eco57I restriction-modification methylase domain-containing protein, partial [Mariniphaga sp.]
MKLQILSPAKCLNKAYLKQSLKREQIELFKSGLQETFGHIDESQDEEYHKNLISKLLIDVYYKDRYLVNVNKKQDLVIRDGNKPDDQVAVIIEFKKPTEKRDMVSMDKPNVKALQELVLYYLRETIDNINHKITYLIATNIYEWFIFDEIWFETNIFKNSQLKKEYENWKVSGHDTRHFYEQIAAKYLNNIEEEVPCTYFNLKDFEQVISNSDKEDDNALIELYKILSPEHLLKKPFANDSNTLNKEFYNELLHIIGLEETKDGNKKLITRKEFHHRDEGSLIENAINILKRDKRFGYEESTENEQKYFELALELCITWLNRILFLKLLEGQLIKYHRGDESHSFLNATTIKDFDELDELFFEVLAVPIDKRSRSVTEKFGNIPYLNSSLFEQTETESEYILMRDLKSRLEIPIYQATVFKDDLGKRIAGKKNTLLYLFGFLAAYDFASEGKAKIQEQNKTIINASVLGLIFEKINGYKDGSFFTPGFISMYMCRETIRQAVVQKFNESYNWNCSTFDDIDQKLDPTDKEQRKQANAVINSLKICDPAVGSGHFLVSALNELIAVKSDLRILSYRDGNRIKEYKILIANDELIITNTEDDQLFEYTLNKNGKQIDDLLKLQESLFHEKQVLIENCLFGVDLNPKSVMICRLRLWVELLKNSYYRPEMRLETLPNIDINIKCGNSLISRFAFDSKTPLLAKDRPYLKGLIANYKVLVAGYKNTTDKKSKDHFRKTIHTLKMEFEKFTFSSDKQFLQLKEVKDKLGNRQFSFFYSEEEKNKWLKETEQLTNQVATLENQYAEKLRTIFGNTMEWRFEFPEVLDDEGEFIGFDVVIGNPPYISLAKDDKNSYYKTSYSTFNTSGDIYCLFYEFGQKILKANARLAFITSNKWLRANYGKELRKFLLENTNPQLLIDFSWYQVFENASVDTNILSYLKQPNSGIAQGVLANNEFNIEQLSQFVADNIHPISLSSKEYWSVTTDQREKVKLKLKSIGKPLEEWGLKINYGIKTALNEVFIIDDPTKHELVLKDPNSINVLKPLLRGRDIEKYATNFQDLWLIFFPKGFTIKRILNLTQDSDDETDRLKEPMPRYGYVLHDEAWDYIANNYSAIARHLLPYKQKAENRSDQGDYWWELRACDYYQEFEMEKLVWAETMRVHKTGSRSFPRFGYDNRGQYTDKTAFIGIGKSIK